MKVLVEFDSIEQAQAAIHAVSGHQSAAPAPHFQPNVEQAQPAYAPQPPQQAPVSYAPPAPPQQQQYAPQPPQSYAPLAPPQMQQNVAPAPGPAAPPSSAQAAGNFTTAQVTAAFQQYCRANTAKAGKEVLREFSVDSAAKIDPSYYAAFMHRIGGAA